MIFFHLLSQIKLFELKVSCRAVIGISLFNVLTEMYSISVTVYNKEHSYTI